jgi:hypothetical protein
MLTRTAGIAALAAALTACGGQSVNDGNASGGTSATGGSGGTTATGGSGGTTATGGASTGGASTGGASGVECNGDIQQKATLGGPNVGFDALPGTPGPVLVANVLPNSLELNPGPDGGTFEFSWAGPDLTKKFKPGEMVSVGSADGWDFVMGDAYTAVARRDYGFVAPSQIPDMPGYGPHLEYVPQCSFLEAAGGCGQPPASVTVLALGATTGAGIVMIPFSATETFMGWEITNVNNVQFPGYGSSNCDVEAGFAGIITAVGLSLDMAE